MQLNIYVCKDCDMKKKPKSKRLYTFNLDFFMVEVTGLEPTTSWSLTKRATKLRYTSIKAYLII